LHYQAHPSPPDRRRRFLTLGIPRRHPLENTAAPFGQIVK
jgi:hypothetical protein